MPPSWRPVPACIRNGHSAGGKFINAATTAAGGTILICGDDKAAGGQFFPATTIKQQAEPFNFAATALRRRNCNTLRRRKLESDAAPLRQILLQASYSTCRHDGTAVILEFKPRLENRCSQKVKTGAIHASILDFKPKLANRCSAEVKTGVIPPAQGRTALCRGRGMPDGQGLRTA